MSKSKNGKKNEKTLDAEQAVKNEQKPDAGVLVQAEPQGEAPLNAVEEMKLIEFEKHIEQNLRGLMVVGMALKAISDDKLYRAKFKKFEDYCQERWELSDKYAYRLIEAYTCVNWLQKELKKSPIGEVRLPTNESQVRPLTSLEPEEQVKAWEKVLKTCKGKPITADEVEAVVNEMGGKPPKTQTATPKTELKKASTKLEKIDKLVTKALEEDESELTVAKLKEVLEKIQKLLGVKK